MRERERGMGGREESSIGADREGVMGGSIERVPTKYSD